jgi:hypothetical protein
MWPERLERFIRRARRRLRGRLAGFGLALGSLAALTIAPLIWFRIVGRTPGVVSGAVVLLAVAAACWWRTATRSRDAAAAIEHAAPQFRNLLITSVELAEQPDGTPPPIRDLVWEDAARIADSQDVARLIPTGRAALSAVVGTVVWLAAVTLPSQRTNLGAVASAAVSPDEALITDVRVRVEPPEYSRLEPESAVNPSRIEALAGSRVAREAVGRATVVVGWG